jgi:SAM-dependent methyltransferase
MKRIPEPELMEEAEQAAAYAAADFAEANSLFVDLFDEAFPGEALNGWVLDLGCGPADIPLRMAGRFPNARFQGVDGSSAMLDHARRAWEVAGLSDRGVFIQARVPGDPLPRPSYDAVISNSLLHHLADPGVLWSAVSRYAGPGAPVLVMDLVRPPNAVDADRLVDRYAEGAPDVLRRDFRASLHAAFEVDEVAQQLREAGLGHFAVRRVSDRHLAVSGRF